VQDFRLTSRIPCALQPTITPLHPRGNRFDITFEIANETPSRAHAPALHGSVVETTASGARPARLSAANPEAADVGDRATPKAEAVPTVPPATRVGMHGAQATTRRPAS